MFESEVKDEGFLKYENKSAVAAKSKITEIVFIESNDFKISKIIMAKEITIDLIKNLKTISIVKINPKKSGTKNDNSWIELA